jgi:nucleoid DNA-binding protein
MATTTKKDLIERVAQETNLPRADVRRAVQSFLEHVIDELSKGNRLEFRDFGVFEIRERAGRVAQQRLDAGADARPLDEEARELGAEAPPEVVRKLGDQVKERELKPLLERVPREEFVGEEPRMERILQDEQRIADPHGRRAIDDAVRQVLDREVAVGVVRARNPRAKHGIIRFE